MLNAKAQRTSVSNAAESLLVHVELVDGFLPIVVSALQDAGVVVHRDEAVALIPGVVAATDDDHAREYLSLDRRSFSGSQRGHRDARPSDGAPFRGSGGFRSGARQRLHSFTDGAEFGFGAEIGISTQKLHAGGPMGLLEMTSTTCVVTGDGHVR